MSMGKNMKKASKKTTDKIKKLAKLGKVVVRKKDAEAFSNIDLSELDHTVTGAEIEQVWGRWRRGKNGNDGGFDVAWQTKSAGFGHATFYLKKGKLHCSNECMGREFLKAIMCRLVEEAILEDD